MKFNMNDVIKSLEKVPKMPKNKIRVAHLLEWSTCEECIIDNKLLENIKMCDIDEAIDYLKRFRNGSMFKDNILVNMVQEKSAKVLLESMHNTQLSLDDEDFF